MEKEEISRTAEPGSKKEASRTAEPGSKKEASSATERGSKRKPGGGIENGNKAENNNICICQNPTGEENAMEPAKDYMCSSKKKERSQDEKKCLMNRLKRIEGQVRGLQKMLNEDAYCTDILVQAAAVNAAVSSFSRTVLEEHIKTCVANNLKNGNDEVIEELLLLLRRMMK